MIFRFWFCTVQVPGVAINSSSAITGVEPVCSPPPQHRPFSLPETYMHGRDAKAADDLKFLPGEGPTLLEHDRLQTTEATRMFSV